MAEQLIITTNNKTLLKPLLISALEQKKKILDLGIVQTQARLADFEQEFGMTSAEFEQRLNTRVLAETVTFSEWRMEIGMLQLLKSQYQALEEVQLD